MLDITQNPEVSSEIIYPHQNLCKIDSFSELRYGMVGPFGTETSGCSISLTVVLAVNEVNMRHVMIDGKRLDLSVSLQLNKNGSSTHFQSWGSCTKQQALWR